MLRIKCFNFKRKFSNQGAASVTFQMLNAESRKYFNRAFASSGTGSVWFILRKANHVPEIRKCLRTNETNMDKLVAQLKTADRRVLQMCSLHDFSKSFVLTWVPTVEKANAREPFLTKSPNDIYNSDDAPIMDSLFSFNAEVSEIKGIY